MVFGRYFWPGIVFNVKEAKLTANLTLCTCGAYDIRKISRAPSTCTNFERKIFESQLKFTHKIHGNPKRKTCWLPDRNPAKVT